MLAFRLDVEAAFEPAFTVVSRRVGVIGAGVLLAISTRHWDHRFATGLMIDVGIAALHYVGQAAYAVTGDVVRDRGLVAASLLLSLPLAGAATVLTGVRNRNLRALGAPLFLLAIAVLHASALLPGLDLPSLPEAEEREAKLVGANGQLVPVRVLRAQVQLGRSVQTSASPWRRSTAGSPTSCCTMPTSLSTPPSGTAAACTAPSSARGTCGCANAS